MKRIILLTALMFSACQSQTATPQQPQTTELAISNNSSMVSTQPVAPEFIISERGIGKAKLGMTLKNLKQISNKNTTFETIPSFMTDIDAIAVSYEGIVQYYILYFADRDSRLDGSVVDEGNIITALMTDNDSYQTKQGIKVGTPIKEAEEIYGNAVLAYNTEGESREYITFGGQNPENIRFRASYFKLISDGLGF